MFENYIFQFVSTIYIGRVYVKSSSLGFICSADSYRAWRKRMKVECIGYNLQKSWYNNDFFHSLLLFTIQVDLPSIFLLRLFPWFSFFRSIETISITFFYYSPTRTSEIGIELSENTLRIVHDLNYFISEWNLKVQNYHIRLDYKQNWYFYSWEIFIFVKIIRESTRRSMENIFKEKFRVH